MNVLKIDYKSPSASKLLDQSLRKTGFAIITNHPIQSDEIEQTYESWARFFNGSSKRDYLFDPSKQSGYFPFKSENAKNYKVKDLKEFFHVFPDTLLPNDVGQVTRSVQSKLIDMASVMLGWLQSEIPDSTRSLLSMPLPEMIRNSNKTLFRVIHYPPLGKESDLDAVRAAAHEDINLLTLLPAATAPGLQVKSLDNQWHEVDCDAGSIIVNSGDMLHLATDGYYPSTTHRVVNPTDEGQFKSRYSMPLFLHPSEQVYLGKGLTAEQYLNQRLEEIGLKK